MVTPFQDPDTGEYEGVPVEIDVQASALLAGVPPTPPGPAITDAFKFYLSENVKPIAEQRKKQEQRYARSERNLIAVVGSDKLISALTKEDARKWRDMRVAAGVAPATVIRERNDIAAVIATALSELSDGGNNPFANLKLPKAKASRQDDRDALPLSVIEGMYVALADEPDLLWIWTLLDFTGARPSEIRQLMVSEIMLSDPIPHIVIQERDDRTLKTSWSTRLVPLVGDAVAVAGEVVRRRNDHTAPGLPPLCRGGRDGPAVCGPVAAVGPKVRLRVAAMPHADKFQLHIHAALAKQKREFISLRTKAARGVKLGRMRDATGRRNVAVQAQARAGAERIAGIIVPLRHQGATLRAIADALNASGIPTARGGSWQASQVQRTLERLARV